MNFSIILNRISQIEGTKNKSQIAKALNMNTQNLYNYAERESIPYERIITYANTKRINLNWLFRDEGELYSADENKPMRNETKVSKNEGEDAKTIKISLTESGNGKSDLTLEFEKDAQIAKVIRALRGLPEREIEKIYHTAELERLKREE